MKSTQELNEAQRKAVEHESGPLLIAAGAGSGKTKTLTSRVIHLLQSGIGPENIIAITFTNKAAREMELRIKNHEFWNKEAPKALIHNSRFVIPFIGTFHSLGVRILKKEAGLVGRTGYFTIFDEDDSLRVVKNILKELNLPKEKFNPIAVMSKISRAKNELLDSSSFGSGQYEKIAATVFDKYEEALKESNAFDFDDLIEKVVRILQSNPKTLEGYQKRWQHILIDEFQDVNTSQYLFVKLLAQKHQNIFAIGDDAQSIYAFRGSDFRNFLNFEKDWPSAKVIKLEENYRSTQNIIRAASELIKKNKMQKPKELWTKNNEGETIQIRAFQNGDEEAWGTAEKVVELLKSGRAPEEIAILYRTNAQSRAIEQALLHLRIPYEIFGGLRFYARKEIKDIIAGIRYAFNPKDAASIDRLLKTFPKFKNEILLKELPRLRDELSLVELINFFLENTDYLEHLEKKFKNLEERQENIKELINFAATFKDAREFLERVTLLSSLDGKPNPSASGEKAAVNPVRGRGGSSHTSSLRDKQRASASNGVKLMTVHLAKGLEFEQVFIVGANDGLLPHERSIMKSDELEEERRLMYVAMTRAKENLNISFYDLPSRFLGELPPELIEFKQVSSYGEENRDWDDEAIYIE